MTGRGKGRCIPAVGRVMAGRWSHYGRSNDGQSTVTFRRVNIYIYNSLKNISSGELNIFLYIYKIYGYITIIAFFVLHSAKCVFFFSSYSLIYNKRTHTYTPTHTHARTSFVTWPMRFIIIVRDIQYHD